MPGLSVDSLEIDPTAETIQPTLKKLKTVEVVSQSDTFTFAHQVFHSYLNVKAHVKGE